MTTKRQPEGLSLASYTFEERCTQLRTAMKAVGAEEVPPDGCGEDRLDFVFGTTRVEVLVLLNNWAVRMRAANCFIEGHESGPAEAVARWLVETHQLRTQSGGPSGPTNG